MIVHLETDGCTVSDGDNLTDLRIVTGIEDGSVLLRAAADAGFGEGPGDATHAYLDVERLRALARPAGERADWDERFDAMIAYAQRKSWLSADGRAVRAHVDRPV